MMGSAGAPPNPASPNARSRNPASHTDWFRNAAVRDTAWWIAPSLLCLLLYWPGFTAWFRADDFAWLGVGLYIRNFHDFLAAMFSPQAQGTIRPWSERAFFMAGFSLFGLDALPFRIVIFATQFANLALIATIGARLTGRRAAGFWAAVFWVLNSSQTLPLGWVCVYNQVMCGFFLLLALHFLMKAVEVKAVDARSLRLERRYEALQWLAFLLGFGASELNLVYPAIAASYILFGAGPGRRQHFRRTLPMFAVSLVYVAIHNAVAPPRTGYYAMHFTGAIFRTLARYWTWSVGPTFLETPLLLPKWVLPAGVAVISLALLAFLVSRTDHRLSWSVRRSVSPLFCLCWYLAAIAPVLPLRDHMTEYYVYLPVIGLCWLGGWAMAEAWSSSTPGSTPASTRGSVRAKAVATAILALYTFLVVPEAVASTAWNHRIAARVRNLVEGVAQAHELHPMKSILLDGVDTDLFWNGILDRPFRLIGLDHVYLTSGSERRIAAHPDLGNVSSYVLPPDVAGNALERDEVVVYDVRGPRLRNITSVYAAMPRETRLPSRVDVASPLTSYLLGPEWYPSDEDHRWMPKRATLRMAGPTAAGQKLYLAGQCPEEQLRSGPLPVTVTVEGGPLAPAEIRANVFELAFALPDGLVGKPEIHVVVEVGRVFRPASDPRDLGVVFGAIEVR